MENKLKVWHDPQHGGPNRGTAWFGLVEKFWVVEMSKSLVPILDKLECEQELARTRDELIPYGERAQAAKAWGADIAFLHHVNAMVYPKKHEKAGDAWEKFDGLMTFALLADHIGMDVAKVIGRCAPVDLLQKKPTYAASSDPDDWTNETYNCLVNYREMGVPAVLIEWGFATSSIDREVLRLAKYRPSLCASVACGVGRAIELLTLESKLA